LAGQGHKPERAWPQLRRRESGGPNRLAEAVRRVLRLVSDQRRSRTTEFVEPVALSSTPPGNFRLPPTASRWSFNLVALRARRTNDYLTPTALLHWEGAAAGPFCLIAGHGRCLSRDRWSKRRLHPVRTGAVRTRSRADARAETRSDSPYPWRERVSAQLGASSATVLAALLLVAACGGAKADEETIALARQAYAKAKARGVDMSRGPCLGVIKEGWVAGGRARPSAGRSTTGRKTICDLPRGRRRPLPRARPQGKLHSLGMNPQSAGKGNP
jgi:hypothetical protein